MKPYYKRDGITIYLGDCLEIMPKLVALGILVDAVIADLPYGTTACSWDTIIPFEPLWENYKRLVGNGPVVLFGSQPFTSKLVMSNLEWFKYEWIWEKVMVSNIAAAKIQPLRSHENISVFSCGSHIYNPQLGKAKKPFGKRSVSKSKSISSSPLGINYQVGVGYPKSIIKIHRPNNLTGGGLHPTQKPLRLLEFLVKTYTNQGDIVLDNCIGSGTTAIACQNANRRFVGIEKEKEYIEIAIERIETNRLKLNSMLIKPWQDDLGKSQENSLVQIPIPL